MHRVVELMWLYFLCLQQLFCQFTQHAHRPLNSRSRRRLYFLQDIRTELKDIHRESTSTLAGESTSTLVYSKSRMAWSAYQYPVGPRNKKRLSSQSQRQPPPSDTALKRPYALRTSSTHLWMMGHTDLFSASVYWLTVNDSKEAFVDLTKESSWMISWDDLETNEISSTAHSICHEQGRTLASLLTWDGRSEREQLIPYNVRLLLVCYC